MLKTQHFEYFKKQLKEMAEGKKLLKIYCKPLPVTDPNLCFVGYIEEVRENAIMFNALEYDPVLDCVLYSKPIAKEILIRDILIGALEDPEKKVLGDLIEKEADVKLE